MHYLLVSRLLFNKFLYLLGLFRIVGVYLLKEQRALGAQEGVAQSERSRYSPLHVEVQALLEEVQARVTHWWEALQLDQPIVDILN